jgi:serine/threonine protein kinase
MALAAGTILGQYQIRSPLGAGGMGEVYRAHDTRLDREVAIKVLPESLTADPERLRCFEQEARATAALNHPNILGVFQMATDNGVSYLVEELLEGETLRERLRRGSISLRKAIDHGVQIAHGLAAAHDKGIVHRDLKPENLFLTKDGRVKILDFGPAKLHANLETSADGRTATIEEQTGPGKVLGTIGYMSPEQVRSKNADHRSDIFALGTILYEMVTGKQTFRKPTSAETMTAILNEEPPSISQITPAAPPGMQRVVHRCLEKTPNSAFNPLQTWRSLWKRYRDSGTSPAVTTQAPSRRRPGRALVWSIALMAVILVAAVAWFEIASRNSSPPLRIADYTQLTHNGHAGYVVGTDGSRLYLTHLVNHRFSIYQVAVSGGEIEPVSSVNLPNPELLDVSPDGSTFLVKYYEKAFSSFSAPLYTVQVVGGSHRYLADAVCATWSPAGKLVAYSMPNGDINIINNDGTGVHKLASVGGVASSISWSPDARTIRFKKDNSFWEITSSGSNFHPLLPGWHPSEDKCCGRWSPDGEIFAFLGPGPAGPDAQIYALDERRGPFRRTANEPFQLTSGPINWDAPVFSKDGKKIFSTGSTRRGELARLDPQSNQFQPFLGGISADQVAFSKDGQSVAYVTYPDGILWRANRDGSDRIQLTNPPLQPISVAWSPDDSQLVFMATSPQGYKVWIVPSNGGSPQRLLLDDSEQQTDPSWSPDGRKIVFATNMFGSSTHESYIRILDLASHQITTLPGSDGKFSPRWSPDGQFIKADSLDVSTLYIFNTKTRQWSTLYKGVFAYALWSSNSRYLYFLRYADDPAILRIPAAGGEANVVASLKGFPFTGILGVWFGLDPTDAPLMLRDVSTTDVHALTLEQK